MKTIINQKNYSNLHKKFIMNINKVLLTQNLQIDNIQLKRISRQSLCAKKVNQVINNRSNLISVKTIKIIKK